MQTNLGSKPKTLVLFELNEYNLYAINQELQAIKQNLKLNTKIVAALGSVQRENRVKTHATSSS